MARQARAVRWEDWVHRWDRQQTAYIPHREQRFETMAEIVGALGRRPPRFIDLACGPGSLSDRLLARLPSARAVAVDFDPVLLELGRRTLRRFAHRITWVEADLRDPGWSGRLPRGPYDAVLSTTALHWLSPADLTRVYRQLHALLRPGGALLNGDTMAFDANLPAFRRLARTINHARTRSLRAHTDAEDWETWWRRLRTVPQLQAQFALRDERFPHAHHRDREIQADFHATALREAGFREVGIVWQDLDNRVLLGMA